MPAENGKRVSQSTFAEKLGVHWVTVSSWERGKYPPTLDNLAMIARETGKPIEFFTAPEPSSDEDEEAAEPMADLMPALMAALKPVMRVVAVEIFAEHVRAVTT